MSRSQIVVEKVMTAQAVLQAATGYSSSVDFRLCTGDAAVLIVSTAGSITVTQQCSFDGVTWYDPETASGAAGAVEDTITVTTGRYLSFTPVVCAYTRFKVVEGNTAPTAVSLTIVYRVEV